MSSLGESIIDGQTRRMKHVELGLWLMLTISIVQGALLMLFYPTFNHDVALYFSSAQVLYEGGKMFVDINDTNPPLVIYLNLIPVWVSKTFSLNPVPATNISFYILLLAGIFPAGWAMRYVVSQKTIASTTIFVMIWLHLGFSIMHLNQFGQRDQLVIAWLLPYLVLVATRLQGKHSPRLFSIIAGLLTVLAVLIKPYYVVFVFSLEILLRFMDVKSRYRIRIENAPWIVGILLIILLIIGSETYREYVWTWVPLVFKYYSAYGTSYSNIVEFALTEPFSRILLIAGMIVSAILWNNMNFEHKNILRLYVFASLICVAIYLLQAKGYLYHRFPVWYLVAAILALGMNFVTSRSVKWYAVLLLPALLLLLQLGMSPRIHARLQMPLPAGYQNEFSSYLRQESAPNERIAVLSMVVGASFPALTYAGRLPVIRYTTGYPLAMAYVGTDTYELEGERKYLADTYYNHIIEDIEKHNPDIIAIDTVTYFRKIPENFNMATWLEYRGFYETVLKGYEKKATIHILHVYHRRESTREHSIPEPAETVEEYQPI